jgi:hypothetical protein
MAQPLQWYDEKADNSPWIEALAEVRHRATREGVTSMSRQSRSRLISMQRRRWATATTFSISPMALVSFAARKVRIWLDGPPTARDLLRSVNWLT